MTITRIKQLAGLKEAILPSNGQIDDNDNDADREDDARYDREQRVRIVIKTAFKKIGLELDPDGISEGVFYDERENREAIVALYENEVDLDLLMKLQQSGIANKFIVEAGQHELSIKFNVAPEIDHVVMKG